MVGVIGESSAGWAIFDTYADGYAGLGQYITYACSGNWGLYPPGTTFLQFCNTYAYNPSPTSYINPIATALGINTNTIISTILGGTASTQAAPIPPLDPANLIVTPGVIQLGVQQNSSPAYFVVQQNSYERTWVRYNNSNGVLGSGGTYLNFIDNGPGTNQLSFTIICRDWDNNMIFNAGVNTLGLKNPSPSSGAQPLPWSQQKINIENIFGQIGTPHTFIDPFGQQPHQGPYPGVYITNLVETIDPSSTPDSPCSMYAVTCLQAPPGPIVDQPTSQPVQPPVASSLLQLPIIALGKQDVSTYNFFAVAQGQYTRTWGRYNASTPISGSPFYTSFVDYGPGINEYDIEIICRTWDSESLPYKLGVTQSWAVL